MRLRRSGVAAFAVAALIAMPAARAEDKDVAMLAKGLGFLIKAQHENGGWGELPGAKEKGELGFTALIVQALAKAKGLDEATAKAARASAEKGAAFLLKGQQSDGSFTHEKSGLTTYRTSLSLAALRALDAEKYKDPIAKAVAWIKKAQFDGEEGIDAKNPHWGGFAYDKTGEKPDADLSNTHFALSALREAGVPADDPVFKRALEFVTRCQNSQETNKGVPGVIKPKNDGGLYYGPTRGQSAEDKAEDGSKTYESYASMTYAGLMSFLHSGLAKDDPRVKAAVGWIKEHYTLEENYGMGIRSTKPKAALQGLYYYYLAFAKGLAAFGEATIETSKGKREWARDLLDVLASKQKPDGSWVNSDSERWMEGNPVLATAYSVNAIELAIDHRAGKK